jgi:hypothetical protein
MSKDRSRLEFLGQARRERVWDLRRVVEDEHA